MTCVRRPENFYASRVTFIFFFVCNNLARALYRALCACMKFCEKIDKRVKSKKNRNINYYAITFHEARSLSFIRNKNIELSWTFNRIISVNAFIF